MALLCVLKRIFGVCLAAVQKRRVGWIRWFHVEEGIAGRRSVLVSALVQPEPRIRGTTVPGDVPGA